MISELNGSVTSHGDEFSISSFETEYSSSKLMSHSFYKTFHTWKEYEGYLVSYFTFPTFDKEVVETVKKIAHIFSYIGDKMHDFQIGIDLKNGRNKIYITTAGMGFDLSNKCIYLLSKVLKIDGFYCLEQDHFEFGCLGIDVTKSETGLKVYERLPVHFYSNLLPDPLLIPFVKDSIILKTFGKSLLHNRSRVKKYLRFDHNNYPSIDFFKKDFDIPKLWNIVEENNLMGLAKAYTLEGDERRLYFK